VHISARTDYALRALVEMTDQGVPLSADAVAAAQEIPRHYIAAILADLRRAGLVISRRGRDSGYVVRAPETITVADVMRAVDGPLLTVREDYPEDLAYPGEAKQLQVLWVAARAALRSVLEAVTIEQIVKDEIAAPVLAWTQRPGAWRARPFQSDEGAGT
jgi:Rrf2 family protein